MTQALVPAAQGALPATTQGADLSKRELALIRALGFDKLTPEVRELTLAIADRYDLDPMLRHLVMVEGKPFITRDGLLWVAHRSGVFDGIEVTLPEKVDRYWRCTASVWRKDMSRPTVYPGRYPAGAKNDEEMAIKCAESMALRRAFNVAAPVLEERWAMEDAPADQPSKPKSLAAVARERAAAVFTDAAPAAEPAPEPPADEIDEAEAVEVPADWQPAEPPQPVQDALCAALRPYGDNSTCALKAGHQKNHKSAEGTWA